MVIVGKTGIWLIILKECCTCLNSNVYGLDNSELLFGKRSIHFCRSMIYEVMNVYYCYSSNFVGMGLRLGGELFCFPTVSLFCLVMCWPCGPCVVLSV